MRKLSDSDAPQACPECAFQARKIVSVVNHSFAHTVVGGPRPQNTGVHKIDYNYDMTIGMDSAQRWADISARQAHKRDVIRKNPGATGFDLSKTHEGDYRVMKPEERQAAEKGRKIHRDAMNSIAKTKTGAG